MASARQLTSQALTLRAMKLIPSFPQLDRYAVINGFIVKKSQK
jgi:hypothetical protein